VNARRQRDRAAIALRGEHLCGGVESIGAEFVDTSVDGRVHGRLVAALRKPVWLFHVAATTPSITSISIGSRSNSESFSRISAAAKDSPIVPATGSPREFNQIHRRKNEYQYPRAVPQRDSGFRRHRAA